jgi:hypothetical protein
LFGKPGTTISPATPRSARSTKSKIIDVPEGDTGRGSESDSDSDSLADLEETPSKKQRRLPTRQTRGVTKYCDDSDVGVLGGDDTEDEYDPFKLREEEEKREARKNRSRRYVNGEDDD